jgi:hypothetical protein
LLVSALGYSLTCCEYAPSYSYFNYGGMIALVAVLKAIALLTCKQSSSFEGSTRNQAKLKLKLIAHRKKEI